jgi:GNAT superfamily N-acetyltransferase
MLAEVPIDLPRAPPVIPIRTMTADDLPEGLRLSRQAGWNQTEADWSRLFDLQPDGCFVADREGVPVGTVATCLFGPVAWVAMVLVEESARGRGIGRALVAHALAFLDGKGIRTVRLDATPLGLPLYEKLGFVAEYRLDRYQGQLPGPERPADGRPITPELRDGLIALDRAVTGTDRGKLLRRLVDERPETVRVVLRDDRVDGFLMARPGSRAWQIGPCIAGPEAGTLLLDGAWHSFAGRAVLIDVPTDHDQAQAMARAGGLSIQRHLMRMRRGEKLVERVASLWAGAGPEKG